MRISVFKWTGWLLSALVVARPVPELERASNHLAARQEGDRPGFLPEITAIIGSVVSEATSDLISYISGDPSPTFSPAQTTTSSVNSTSSVWSEVTVSNDAAEGEETTGWTEETPSSTDQQEWSSMSSSTSAIPTPAPSASAEISIPEGSGSRLISPLNFVLVAGIVQYILL